MASGSIPFSYLLSFHVRMHSVSVFSSQYDVQPCPMSSARNFTTL